MWTPLYFHAQIKDALIHIIVHVLLFPQATTLDRLLLNIYFHCAGKHYFPIAAIVLEQAQALMRYVSSNEATNCIACVLWEINLPHFQSFEQ